MVSGDADTRLIAAESNKPVRSNRLRAFCYSHAGILLPSIVFLAFVLLVNWPLFLTPMAESGDVAVNALQVQNAKRFGELLGNYSRWHFHHPGPFFFYLFAGGEALFYNLLHIVPAPMNGECLAEILFSTACLFTAIYVFDANVRKPLFPLIAILSTILFVYGVDSVAPASLFVCLWPPYMALFCFLLFAVCCCSIAAGNWKHLPLLAFSGMAMIHAHVAQVFFVPILAVAALIAASIRDWSHGRSLRIFRIGKGYFAATGAIVLLFLLPIVIDWAVNHPNNIHQIRSYLRQYHGLHNSLSISLLYVISFFTFGANVDTVLAKPTPGLADLISPQNFVQVYWCIFLLLALFCGASYITQKVRLSFFLKSAFAEVGLIILLFVYWSWRITGPMYMFNGYFFFSVQLLFLLGLSALLSSCFDTPALTGPRLLPFACACPALLLMIPYLRTVPGDRDVAAITSSALKKGAGKFAISLPMMPTTVVPAAGVASYLQRSGKTFCIDPEWDFVFGVTHVCRNTDGFYRLTFNENPTPCNVPCTLIYSRAKLFVAGALTPAFLGLPAIVSTSNSTGELTGFNPIETTGAWSRKESSVTFYLKKPQGSSMCRLGIKGNLYPGRPARVGLNGTTLGTNSKCWGDHGGICA